MPDAAIMSDRVDGRLVLEHDEARPAFECGDVTRANTESYGHSYNEYGIVSVGSGDDYSAVELDNAPENRAQDCPADVVADLPEFNFVVNSLSIRRNVGRQLLLEDLENITYVCSGSNSLIFSAIWNNKDVVVKTLQRSKTSVSLAVTELNLERNLLSRADHPNIIRILGMGMIPKPFIVLERLQDIAQLCDFDRPHLFRRRPFSFIRILQIAQNLADALKYLHIDMHPDAMIIHRDIKPENLGLDSNGQLKLFDFGLCQCVKKRKEERQVYKMTGNTGSLRYMAPEVVLGRPYNEKVDVYSFAIVMWALATGREPFSGFDVASHRLRVAVNGERPKLKKSWPDDFKDLLTDCWQFDYSKRPDFKAISYRITKAIVCYNGPPSARPAINTLCRNMTMPSFIFNW